MDMASSAERAQAILSITVAGADALDLAYTAEAKSFLAQRHVQALVDLRWRSAGGVHSPIKLNLGFSYITTLMQARQ